MLNEIGPSFAPVLFRSVSPWEMHAILETGLVTGRGGVFAGDPRASDECHIWFAEAIKPIIHSGEDYLRYFQGLPDWDELHEALDALRDLTRPLYKQMQSEYPLARRAAKVYHAASDLERGLGEVFREALYDLARQARASTKRFPTRSPTSYVIEIHDMLGGTRYTAEDSLQGDAAEVCFPRREAARIYSHIEAVHLVGVRGTAPPKLNKSEMEWLEVRLPKYRQATVDAVLRIFARLRPKIDAVLGG